MSDRHIPGAGWAIMALLTIGVLAVLVAGGVFDDHRSEADKRATDYINNYMMRTPRP